MYKYNSLTHSLLHPLSPYLLFLLIHVSPDSPPPPPPSSSLSPSPSLTPTRRVEQQRRKERNEAHLFITVEIYQEDDFQCHQRADLIDFDEVKGGYVSSP